LLFIPYLSVVGDALLHPIKLLIADLALRVALLQDFQSALRFLAAWAITAAPARAAASASAKHQVEREQHHPGYKDGKKYTCRPSGSLAISWACFSLLRFFEI
jgi:hypothetical protein